MKQLIDSVESSLKERNWPAALNSTLTLPDIAGKISYPITASGKRYADWFDEYVGAKYKSEVGAGHNVHTFLSGKDCYALRCSLLHEGSSNIKEQSAKDVLDDFMFVAPPKSGSVHCNQFNQKLQLQVDIFCNDILRGLKQWIKDIDKDPVKQSNLRNLMKIHQIM